MIDSKRNTAQKALLNEEVHKFYRVCKKMQSWYLSVLPHTSSLKLDQLIQFTKIVNEKKNSQLAKYGSVWNARITNNPFPYQY